MPGTDEATPRWNCDGVKGGAVPNGQVTKGVQNIIYREAQLAISIREFPADFGPAFLASPSENLETFYDACHAIENFNISAHILWWGGPERG